MRFFSQFICSPMPRFASSHAANLVVMPGGRLAFICFRGSAEGEPDTVLTMQTLQSDGAWTEPRIIVEEPGYPVGNGVLMPVHDGRVLIFYTLSYAACRCAAAAAKGAHWSHCLVHYRASADGGATWGERGALTEEFGYICRNPAIRMSNGEYLLPIYDNRGGGRPGFEGMGGNEGGVAVSADLCQWRRYGRMVAGPGLAQPTVVELENGRLLALLRSRIYWNGDDPRWAVIWRSRSDDYGRNWSHPEPTALPNNNSSIQMIRLQSGVLALAYNHQSGRMRSPLNIALSYDDGATWPLRREIEPETRGAEYSYPAIAQTSDGRIHLAYTWNRTHMKHVAVTQAEIENAVA
ncbi:MAG: exo-alpha-sialidase [bacterium]|nr:exo-alpha-sialidase [bacterium]